MSITLYYLVPLTHTASPPKIWMLVILKVFPPFREPGSQPWPRI